MDDSTGGKILLLNTSTIDTDHLVIGTGGSVMAFVDTPLDETDAGVQIVDRHVRPGGHWDDAYPFVRLHQPAASTRGALQA